MKLYSVDLGPYSARVRMHVYAKGLTDITFDRPEHWGMRHRALIFEGGSIHAP